MGCTFCATGTMGFKSNLTSGEIVEQLVHASRIADIRNIVFMVYFCFCYCILSTLCAPCLMVIYFIYSALMNFIHQLLPWFDDCDQGMGEPLNNYNAVVEAVRVMLNQPFQLSPKRITISTVSTQKATLKHS